MNDTARDISQVKVVYSDGGLSGFAHLAHLAATFVTNPDRALKLRRSHTDIVGLLAREATPEA